MSKKKVGELFKFYYQAIYTARETGYLLSNIKIGDPRRKEVLTKYSKINSTIKFLRELLEKCDIEVEITEGLSSAIDEVKKM